jgi:hypothetical protein
MNIFQKGWNRFWTSLSVDTTKYKLERRWGTQVWVEKEPQQAASNIRKDTGLAAYARNRMAELQKAAGPSDEQLLSKPLQKFPQYI